jgi:dihydrofolate synthase/folylpolyglutamate synthase
LIGNYQVKNICTSIAALSKITELENTEFSDSILFEGFGNIISNSNFYGRFQLLRKRPSIVIDVSHNIEGLSNIQSNLEFFKYDKVIVIFALMKDKKYKKCLEEIERLNATIILTKPKYQRAIDPIKLYKLVKHKENFIIKEDIEEAFLHSKKNAGKNDLILVTGSFFLVGEFWNVYYDYFKSN